MSGGGNSEGECPIPGRVTDCHQSLSEIERECGMRFHGRDEREQ